MNKMEAKGESKPIVTTAAVVLALIVTGSLAFAFDMSFVRSFTPDDMPGELRSILDKAEPFGHGYGVIFILITVWVLTRQTARTLWPLAACSLGAGLAADIVKVFVARIRPRSLLAQPDVESSFAGLMPWLNESSGKFLESSYGSFPSAHTATAVGLAVALGHFFPRGKYWFFALAGMVALQRVVRFAHFPSDACFGAALGIIVATAVIRLYESRQHRTSSRASTMTIRRAA